MSWGVQRVALRLAFSVVVLVTAVSVELLIPTKADAATAVDGSVTEADGTPVQGVVADLFVAEDGRRGQFINSSQTDSHGRFAFAVSPGCYTVTIISPEGRTVRGSRWYQRSICAEGDTTATIAPAVLDATASAGIGGSISFGNGDASEGVVVDLFGQDAQGQRAGYLRSVRTGSDGSYNFSVGVGCYVVTAIAPDGSSFAGSAYFQSAVCVSEGQIRSDIDAVLNGVGQEDSTVSGQALFTDGAPVEGIEVTVWQTGGDGARTNYLRSVYTGSDGRFAADVVPGCYWLIYVAVEGTSFDGSRYREVPLCVDAGQTLNDLDVIVQGPAGVNIDGLEADWAAARARVVASIREQGLGVSEGTLVGPSGFRIDLGDCPAGWRNSPGGTGPIVIGHTTPRSGNLAVYGYIGLGMQMYLEYVNENGGIGGRPVVLDIRDDQYLADRTVELVDQLLREVDPFAIMTLGTLNSLAVNDTLNEQCVPQPFVISGHPAFGDPVDHPWTTGMQMSWATEARLWGEWIESNLADELPVTVAGLVMDNYLGQAYESSFRSWADANPEVVSSFVAVDHDPAAPTVTPEMQTIANLEPDVFLSMTAGSPCLLAILEAKERGVAERASAMFTPSICRDANAYMIPAGSAGDGFLIVDGGAKLIDDPASADDLYMSFVRQQLEDALPPDTPLGLFSTGFASHGWPLIEALRIAADLDGGLTRSNFILAQRAMSLDNPALLDGITFSMNGNQDGYFTEGSTVSRFDASNQTWIRHGSVTDINGSTPNCSWQPATGCQDR